MLTGYMKREPVFGPGLWPFLFIFCAFVALGYAKGKFYGKVYSDDPTCAAPHTYPVCRLSNWPQF